MSTNYANPSQNAILNPRLKEAIVAEVGYLPTNNTHAMSLIFHAPKGGITVEDEAWGSADESQITHGSKLSVNYPVWENDLSTFHNLCILAANQCNLFTQDENGSYHNYIAVSNSDYITTPDGSLFYPLSLIGTKFTNNQKERKIEFMAQGYTNQALQNWLADNATAYTTTGSQVTGGSATAITTLTSARSSRVVVPGFWKVERNGANAVGELNSVSLDFEFVGAELQFNNHVVRQVRYTAKWKSDVMTAAQIKAAVDDAYLDGTTKFYSFAGEVFEFANSRGTCKKFMDGNDWGYIEFTYTGLVSLTGIDWTTPLHPVFTLNVT